MKKAQDKKDAALDKKDPSHDSKDTLHDSKDALHKKDAAHKKVATHDKKNAAAHVKKDASHEKMDADATHDKRRTTTTLGLLHAHKKGKHHHHIIKHRKSHRKSMHAHHHHKIQQNAVKYVRSFRPVQYLLTLVGQFPFHTSYHVGDGTYTYHASFYTPGLFIFLLALVAQFVLIVAMLYNSITIFTGEQYFDPRPRSHVKRNQSQLFELVVISRYRHTFITIWVNLICAFGAQLRLFCRLRYFGDYMGYWSRVVQLQDLDIGVGLWRFSLIVFSAYVFFFGILGLLYAIGFSASFYGVPSLMAIMLFKFYTPDMLTYDDRTINELYLRTPNHPHLRLYQYVGAMTFVIILIWSKSIMLLFVYKCKLLGRALVIFNHRVYLTLIQKHTKHPRRGNISLRVLFMDHCCLLDLIEGTDQLFANIFEPFIGLHLAGLMHELYFLFLNAGQQTGGQSHKSFDNNYFPRPLDFVFSFMMVFQNLFFLVYVARVAIDVGEQAMDGLEVLRRKAMMGRETDEELYFQFSMFQSYSGRMDGCLLRCGGFFTINKGLLTGIFGTFLGYFIIIQQFRPTFEYSPLPSTADSGVIREYREQVGKFLYRLEHLAYCHWIREPGDDCPIPTV